MANVDPVQGVKYGFQLMGYVSAVIFGGVLIIYIGVESEGELGLLIALLGALTINAGLVGILYKVIADGVEKGNLAAERRSKQYQELQDQEDPQNQQESYEQRNEQASLQHQNQQYTQAQPQQQTQQQSQSGLQQEQQDNGINNETEQA
jgi:hypothetical protein